MPKEILVYGPMYSYSATDFIGQMDAAKNEDITVRLNSPGGDVKYGWGMVAKFAEHTGKKTIKIDGEANSMAAYMACYSDDVECLDVSTGTLHRAAYPKWMESNADIMTVSDWASLDATNAKLRTALEAKIDVAKFKKLKGVSMDELFSNNGRRDVELSAEEMKAIGLVNRINSITPQKKAQIEADYQRVAAEFPGFKEAVATAPVTHSKPQSQNKNKMTAKEIKEAHREAYNEILAKGAEKERDRVGAWMAFGHVDIKVVTEGIKSGKDLSQTQTAEFIVKMNNPDALKKLSAEATAAVATTEAETLTPEAKAEKEKEAITKKFLDEVNKTKGTPGNGDKK